IIDVWNKRGARIDAANQARELKRLEVEDALREIVYAVRTAYADVLREQAENKLSREVRARYEETVRLSRERRAAGEISEADLQKTELEGPGRRCRRRSPGARQSRDRRPETACRRRRRAGRRARGAPARPCRSCQACRR